MPELPDVEIMKRYLNRTALHHRVEDVEITSSKVFHGASPNQVREAVSGHALESTRRHGKFLFAELGEDAGWLVLHFGMTGFLKYFKRSGSAPEHARVILDLDNGYRLAYDSQRLFGEVDVTDDVERYLEARDVGPDALALDLCAFIELLRRSRSTIKGALMKQNLIAGIGNIYSDEILFHARINPKTRVTDLDEAALKRLYRAMRRILKKTVDYKADPEKMPRTWLLPHRAEGERCPRCRTPLEHAKLHQRTTWWCPRCQP